MLLYYLVSVYGGNKTLTLGYALYRAQTGRLGPAVEAGRPITLGVNGIA